MNSLRLQVMLDPLLPGLPSITGLFEPAERRLWGCDEGAVDSYCAGLYQGGEAEGAGDVGGIDCGCCTKILGRGDLLVEDCKKDGEGKER
jgi:hypothetical protein